MKDYDFVEVLNCRSCGAVAPDEILNLGDQPLANSLLNQDGIYNEKKISSSLNAMQLLYNSPVIDKC